MPDRLFKYQPFTALTLTNLKKRTLWFSRPSQFNDPFDCATTIPAAQPTDADLVRAASYIKREHNVDVRQIGAQSEDGTFTEDFRESLARGAQSALDGERTKFYHSRGVACLTTKHDDMLMWSHYADGHRGFCLEFDGSALPFSKAQAVRYADQVPSLNILDALESPDGQPMLDAMVLTKAECWRYETEWRLIHQEESTAFTYDWQLLKGVHFGAAMPFEHLEIIALVLQGSPTKLYQMRKVDGRFAVRSEPIEYRPFSYGNGEQPGT